jgi:sugar/nucleoside kinase (ribokinase family)
VLMDVVAIGDNMSDIYLTIDQVFPGGSAVNVGVAVARSGGSSGYVGVVGDDAGGRLLMDSLTAERVNTRRISVVPGPTAWCQITHPGGEWLIGPRQRGVAAFRPDEDDLAFAATASIIHSTYCSGLERCCLSCLAAAGCRSISAIIWTTDMPTYAELGISPLMPRTGWCRDPPPGARSRIPAGNG